MTKELSSITPKDILSTDMFTSLVTDLGVCCKQASSCDFTFFCLVSKNEKEGGNGNVNAGIKDALLYHAKPSQKHLEALIKANNHLAVMILELKAELGTDKEEL